jgi:hypothetical protein
MGSDGGAFLGTLRRFCDPLANSLSVTHPHYFAFPPTSVFWWLCGRSGLSGRTQLP